MLKWWEKIWNKEQRSTDINTGSFSGAGYEALLNGSDSSDPKTVSAVYACLKVITETFATLPLVLKKQDGRYLIEDREHSLNDILLKEPNDFQTWFQFKMSLMYCCLTQGNAYARIVRNGRGQPVSLQYLAPGECSYMYVKSAGIEYLTYYVFGEQVSKDDILHFPALGSNGIHGLSPISLANQTISIAQGGANTIDKFYSNGLRSNAVFTTDRELTEKSFASLKTKLAGQMSKPYFLLDNGLKVSPLTLTPQDAEVIATRRFQVEEIARIFRVPMHKIGELTKSTNNNIEQQNTEFVTDCMTPWCELFEQEFKRKLLFTREKRDYSFNISTDYLMRGDLNTRANYYLGLYRAAAITPNEIRQMEGLNPSDSDFADKLMIQSQYTDTITQKNDKGNKGN